MTPYNIRRIIGYTGLALVVVLLLTGCGLFPSWFDNQEHTRIVNIHVSSSDSTVCQDRELARQVAREMYVDARWLWNYGQHLPSNEKMTEMESQLMAMTQELHERYSKPEPVSAFYCKSKFENIHRATTVIIKVSARRPRI